MITISFALAFAGFLALSLAMKRHYSQVLSPKKAPSKAQVIIFRLLGSICLIISAGICLNIHGVGIGLVLWTGMLTLAALMQSLLLTYKPQWVFSCGGIFLVLGIATGLVS